MATAYIGVGSNIEPYKNIESALILLKKAVTVANCSTFYRTEPLKNRDQDDYINGVWEITTDLEPEQIKFNLLKDIENKLGRKKTADKYSSRTIDLDLILYDDLVVNNKKIILPDKHIYSRSFLALPLYEINESLIIPDTKKTIKCIIGKMDKKSLIPETDFTLRLRDIIVKVM